MARKKNPPALDAGVDASVPDASADGAHQRRLGGRPSLLQLTPEVIQRVEAMAGMGMTEDQIACALGVAPRTFRSYKERHPAFSEAHARGKATGLTIVARRLYQLATQGEARIALTACIFYLKTQGRWSESVRLEGPDGGPIQVDNASAHLETLLGRLARSYASGEAPGADDEPDAE